VIQSMQYELERAYHQRCEANAAQLRLIDEAERTYSAATIPQRSPFEVVVGVWRGVVSSGLPLPWDARLTDSRTNA
jgi:hypothetical protein